MDFLRRLLGRQPEQTTVSQPPGDNAVIVTQDDAVPVGPEEPVIEAPALAENPHAKIRHAGEAAPEENTPAHPVDAGAFAGTRPLPPLESVIPGPGQRLVFGQLSDVGMVRGNNQDAMLTFLGSSASSDDLADFGLFVVADGMGGHHDGEKASAIAARIVARHVIQEIYVPILNQMMDDPDRPTITEVLRAAVQQANGEVTEQIPEGGTTVTMAVILGDLAYIAHVGDSRAYLITEDGIEQLTRDHSLVQRLIELDQLTPEEAAEHPQRNVLYRAIGQNDTLDADAITRRLPPHARLLLCSDGLWNLVPESTMVEIVEECGDLQSACQRLVKLANDRGGPDNITVILVQMPG